MDTSFYLNKFQLAAEQLNKRLFNKKQIEIAVGVILNSVFLKLYKRTWATPLQNPLTAESRIFFSIWINDSTLEQQKIFYNIHALKLRHLKGYSIQSRKFAESFRARFNKFEHNWENVSVKFGPVTLMEGWLKLDAQNLQVSILKLTTEFLKIEHLVDDTLAEFK